MYVFIAFLSIAYAPGPGRYEINSRTVHNFFYFLLFFWLYIDMFNFSLQIFLFFSVDLIFDKMAETPKFL
jgi:hypothetical protein